jgi:hypothetical protein
MCRAYALVNFIPLMLLLLYSTAKMKYLTDSSPFRLSVSVRIIPTVTIYVY